MLMLINLVPARLKFLVANQHVFSIVLSRLVPRDNLAEALSEVLYEMGGTALVDVLRLVISDEVQRTPAPEQLFRTDSIATKMLKVSGRIIGSYWLPAAVGALLFVCLFACVSEITI